MIFIRCEKRHVESLVSGSDFRTACPPAPHHHHHLPAVISYSVSPHPTSGVGFSHNRLLISWKGEKWGRHFDADQFDYRCGWNMTFQYRECKSGCCSLTVSWREYEQCRNNVRFWCWRVRPDRSKITITINMQTLCTFVCPPVGKKAAFHTGRVFRAASNLLQSGC